MSRDLTLAFYKSTEHYSFREAQDRGKAFAVSLQYAERDKGLAQTAIYEAILTIDAVKECFGITEYLTYVLLDGDTILDCD